MADDLFVLERKARLEFNQVPVEARAVLEEYVLRYEYLLPTWVQNVYINWDGCGQGDAATIKCSINYDYRSFSVVFFPGFITQRDDERKRDMIHEFLHASSSVLATWASDTVDLLCPTEEATKFNKSLHAELTQRHESFVQDLALRLADVLP